MGVLSALPFVSAGNVCCCLWVICGGLVAAYVLQQNQPAPITPGDGALVGLLAGLAGALIETIVSIPITMMIGPMERQMLQRFVEMSGNMPSELRDAIERYNNEAPALAFLVLCRVFAMLFLLFIGSIFSTLGGLLGAAIFRRNTPPGTIDVTPITPNA
jgi:hypothetical protein